MSNAPHQPGDQLFENPDCRDDHATYLLGGGIGLIVFAIAAFIFALRTRHGQASLHLTTRCR